MSECVCLCLDVRQATTEKLQLSQMDSIKEVKKKGENKCARLPCLCVRVSKCHYQDHINSNSPNSNSTELEQWSELKTTQWLSFKYCHFHFHVGKRKTKTVWNLGGRALKLAVKSGVCILTTSTVSQTTHTPSYILVTQTAHNIIALEAQLTASYLVNCKTGSHFQAAGLIPVREKTAKG